MAKSSDAPLDSMVASMDVSLANVLLVSLFKEVLIPSPTIVLDIPPHLVVGQDPTPTPILPPSFVRGQSALVTTLEFLQKDPPLAPFVVIDGLSFDVSKEVPSMASLQGATI